MTETNIIKNYISCSLFIDPRITITCWQCMMILL